MEGGGARGRQAGRQGEEEDSSGVGQGVIETLAGCLEHVGCVGFQRIVVDNCGRSRDASNGFRVAESCHPEAAAANDLRILIGRRDIEMRQLPGLVRGPVACREERDIVRFNYRAFVSGNKVSGKEMVDGIQGNKLHR